MTLKLFVLYLVSLTLHSASSLIPASYLAILPAGASPKSIAMDPASNIMLAGSIGSHAFVAKLSPDGQTLLYYEPLGGSGNDVTSALTVDSSGNAYVAGITNSLDFPITPGTLQSSMIAGSTGSFLTKLDASGKLIYSTFFYGAPGQSTSTSGMAVNSAGEVFLTGQTVGGNFPVTPSPIQAHNLANTFFTLRVSASADRFLYSIGGLGGSSIAVDSQNNAYIAGVSFDSDGSEVPVTPDAYQSKAKFSVCGETFAFLFPCDHQYAAKLDPTGTKLIFCTFVSGSSNDSPTAIAVDSEGNVFLAGTTDSSDYPTTSGALQTQYYATPAPPSPFVFDPYYIPLAGTGYLTELSADGSRLIFSTLLGGSQQDGSIGMALLATGQIYVANVVQSPDFPALPIAPQRCLPDRLHQMPVVSLIDPSGATITQQFVVEGSSSSPATLAFAVDGQNNWHLLTDGPFLASGASPSSDPVACIVDAFDYTQASKVSPGQLLTVFGTSIPKVASAIYTSTTQINFAVPYSVAGQPTFSVLGRTIPVTAATPSLATNGFTGYPLCAGQTPPNSVYALVLNPDGTQNSCVNPARKGSTVSLFLNGAGSQQPTVTDLNGSKVVQTIPAPGAPTGIWQVNVTPAATNGGYVLLSFLVGQAPAREQSVPVWISN